MIGKIGAVLLILGLINSPDGDEPDPEFDETDEELDHEFYLLTGKKDLWSRFIAWLDTLFLKIFWLGLIMCLVQIGINVHGLL